MDEKQTTQCEGRPRLSGPGWMVVVGTFLGAFIEGGVLLAAAGTWDWPRAWFFVGVSFVGLFGQILPVAILNPGLVNHRGLWKKKKDTKPWDRALVPLYGLMGFYAIPIVMGDPMKK